MIDFSTHPDRYHHWHLNIEGRVATLSMDIQEDVSLNPGYQLKLNSYDLGVDIELYDAVQRLRFEHPEVAAVILTSAKNKVFCSGANIKMLGLSSHAEKVNFCKFTNETRNGIEDATANSGQVYLTAVNGTAAGGGYELALATDHIILVDDGASAVSLPEVPLLAVLPGTGGLTRIVDKRYVRRDHADFFCTVTEGIKGKRALQWKLVDDLQPLSKLMSAANQKAQEFIDRSDRPDAGKGVELTPLERDIQSDTITYKHVTIELDRAGYKVNIHVRGPLEKQPTSIQGIHLAGVDFWPLALARELDDAILHLRTNEPELGTWVFTTNGDAQLVLAADQALIDHQSDWLVRETSLYLKRVFKRIDVTSRSLITLVEPGSCFAGTLLELVLAADFSFMLDGTFEGDIRPPATLTLGLMNFGPLSMCNDLTRLQTRFLNDDQQADLIKNQVGQELNAIDAEKLGLVTFIPDDIDWEDEVRIAFESRASYSPDALTGMEASLRFGGPETLETKIFGRLSAWQNWIFQRPNAVGEQGALKQFGTGLKNNFDRKRV